MKATGVTDMGMRRIRNEDFYTINHRTSLFAVADGLGGCPAGGLASKAALFYLNFLSYAGGKLGPLICKTSRFLHRLTQHYPQTAGMGTTLTAAWITDGVAQIGHVGDSRAYLFRHGALSALTTDHNIRTENMIKLRSGRTQEICMAPPDALTQSVGRIDVKVEVVNFVWEEGDALLLCTDGLHRMFTEKELREAMLRGMSVQEVVAVTNMRGGPDNITLLVVS